MRGTLFIAFVLLRSRVAAWAAEEPSGCEHAKWIIDHERAARTSRIRVKRASGGEIAAVTPPASRWA